MFKLRKMSALTGGLATCLLIASAAAPDGWYLAGSKPTNYDTGVDQQALNNGRASAFLKAKANQEGFGTLMQDFSAAEYLGKRIRFSGFVKSEGVTRWAGLWMRVDGKTTNQPLAFDNMQDRAIKGTTGWQRYEIVLDVPEGATGIFFGILLDGPGEVWLNTTNIEAVSSAIPTTGRSANKREAPINLGFDK